MNEVEINITCSCGYLHKYLPAEYQLVDGIYWFQCAGGCNSTRTFIPELTKRRLESKIEADRKLRVKAEVVRQNDWVKRNYGIRVKETKELADKMEVSRHTSEFTNRIKE